MPGVLRGFTTFPAFGWQTLVQAHSGQWGRAGLYVTASVVTCLVAVASGLAAAMAVKPSALSISTLVGRSR